MCGLLNWFEIHKHNSASDHETMRVYNVSKARAQPDLMVVKNKMEIHYQRPLPRTPWLRGAATVCLHAVPVVQWSRAVVLGDPWCALASGSRCKSRSRQGRTRRSRGRTRDLDPHGSGHIERNFLNRSSRGVATQPRD